MWCPTPGVGRRLPLATRHTFESSIAYVRPPAILTLYVEIVSFSKTRMGGKAPQEGTRTTKSCTAPSTVFAIKLTNASAARFQLLLRVPRIVPETNLTRFFGHKYRRHVHPCLCNRHRGSLGRAESGGTLTSNPLLYRYIYTAHHLSQQTRQM